MKHPCESRPAGPCESCPAEPGDCICCDDPCEGCPKCPENADARVRGIVGIL